MSKHQEQEQSKQTETKTLNPTRFFPSTSKQTDAEESNTWTHLNAALDILAEVTEYLKEAHQPELDADHGGDSPDDCTYCSAIAESERVHAAAIQAVSRG